MILVISKFRVANGMSAEVKQAFVGRPHLVESAPGFIRLDVVSPSDAPNEIWLLTYWENLTLFQRWHKSAAHKHSHKYIPKGLKLDPTATQIRIFEHVCS
jgi:heme-degrading monooxygenase HmoA